MKHQIAAILVGAGFLAACGDQAPNAPMARVADESQVGACKYVMDMRDKPGAYGVFASKAQEYARTSILRDAAAGGANTVVFQKVEPGMMVTELRATAYKC